MSRITVIIPAYNAETFIAATLESVRVQTRLADEVLLIDDGSNDNTLREARAFLGAMNLRILEQSNAGPAAARNLGIHSATGDYCAFIDCDDLMLPARLSVQAAVLDSDPNLGFVHSDLMTFDQRGIVHRTRRAFSDPSGGQVLHRLLMDNFVTTSTVMAPREKLLAAGAFNENRRLSEDYELWLTMAQRWSVGYVERPLIQYRYSPGSLSHDKFITGCSALDVVRTFWEQNPILAAREAPLRRRSLARHLAFTGNAALAGQPRRTALAYLLRSLALQPSCLTTWKSLVKAIARPRPAARHASSPSIALIGSYPPPHGGQSVHIENLRRHLVAQKHRVTVFNTGTNKGIRQDGVVNISSARQLYSAIRAHRPFSLLHVHVTDQSDYRKLAPVSLAAKTSGIPWIATVHSGNSVAASSEPISRFVARQLLRSAARLIGVNAAITRHLNILTGSETASTIVPFSLGIQGADLPVTLQNFLDTHGPVILCIGLYEPVYGFEQAVRLLARLREAWPRAGLVLAGDRKNSQWCDTLVLESQLGENVMMYGDMDHATCLAVIARASLFLRPTLYDGDSLSVREALAMGIPVVATATDFRPDGVTVYSREDEDGLLQAVSGILAGVPRTGMTAARGEQNLAEVERLYEAVTSNAKTG